MRSLQIEPSDLKSKRQRRDLVLLLALAVVTIGSVLSFGPGRPELDVLRPKNVEHDWTVQIGTHHVGLLADRFYTYIDYGFGYASLPLPSWVFLGCSLLLACLGLIWILSRNRRHNNA